MDFEETGFIQFYPVLSSCINEIRTNETGMGLFIFKTDVSELLKNWFIKIKKELLENDNFIT